MDISVIKEHVQRAGLPPCKGKGQHFLCHMPTLTHLCSLIPTQSCVLEIGPGLGVFSKMIADKISGRFVMVEKDARFECILKQELPQAELTIGDALDIAWTNYPNFMVVGNLPYNISVPLIMKYLEHSSMLGPGLFMVQKEVALRISAQPRTKAYGRLSVMAQTYAAVKEVLEVPPSAFWPVPAVDSSVMFFSPRKDFDGVAPFVDLEKIVAMAFFQRRKMLHHNVRLGGASLWTTSGIDGRRRAETLTVQEFNHLTLEIQRCGHALSKG